MTETEFGLGRGPGAKRPWTMLDVNVWTPRIDFAGPIELMMDDGQVLRIEPHPETGFIFEILPPYSDGGPPGHDEWNEEKPRPRSARFANCAYTGHKVTRVVVALRKTMLEDIDKKVTRTSQEYLQIAEQADPTMRPDMAKNQVRRQLKWAKERYAQHGLRTQMEVARGLRV